MSNDLLIFNANAIIIFSLVLIAASLVVIAVKLTEPKKKSSHRSSK